MQDNKGRGIFHRRKAVEYAYDFEEGERHHFAYFKGSLFNKCINFVYFTILFFYADYHSNGR